MSEEKAASPCGCADHVSRRAVLGGAAAGVGLLVLGGCAAKKDKPAAITNGTVPIGSVQDYPAGTVSNKYMAVYGIAISNDGGTITAIVPRCTHLGCTAPWVEEVNQFVCPCHGSRFDIEGRPIVGPAKKYMARVDVGTDANGALTVNLDRLYALAPPLPPAK